MSIDLKHDVSPEKKRVEICISGWSGSYVLTLHRECYHTLSYYMYMLLVHMWGNDAENKKDFYNMQQ